MTTTRVLSDRLSRLNSLSVIMHDDEVMQFEGRLVVVLIERWGLVTCDESGEDSAGRQKLALMSPDAIVERCCEIARVTGSRLRELEWLTQDISIEALLEKADKKDA